MRPHYPRKLCRSRDDALHYLISIPVRLTRLSDTTNTAHRASDRTVIDTSALIAILQLEAEAQDFANAIAIASRRLLSASSALETSIVIGARKGAEGMRDLDLLLYRTRIEIAPFTAVQADLAREAWQRFGRGNHPAALNFGDCFSYALAKSISEPLLFKGSDFAQTDIVPVM